jgi:hypothetical protein
MTDTSNMPTYKCHKIVHALEVANVGHFHRNPEMGELIRTITFVDGTSRDISEKVFRRTLPDKGWFYVVYDEDYESFAPGPTFLSGYTLIDARTFADIKQGLKGTATGTNLGDSTAGAPK